MSTTGIGFSTPNSLSEPGGKLPKRPARRVGEKSRRGFAAMSPEQQRRIASEGGRASHESGKGHRFSSEEARAAGRKGGAISRRGPKKPPAEA
jgi:general stress protein YciG